MEFRFNDEQQMIRDTAAAFLAEVSDSAAIRRAMATENGFEDAVWQRIAGEMCWQALHIPEEYGGLGLGYVELVALFEQMGRYLLCSPFLSTVAFATNALLVAASDEQKAHWLPQIAGGELTGTLAFISPGGKGSRGSNGPQAVQATFEKTANGYKLDGTLRYVLDGHTAGLLIVAARAKGSSDENGISLFAIKADTAGVQRTWLPTMDQTRKQAEIVLSGVEVASDALLGAEGAGWSALEKTLQLAQIAIAAEQMGGAQQALDITVEYTKGRTQFNRPIASFQSIKHKAADMMMKAESAKSIAYYAACIAQEALFDGEAELAAELPEAAAIAKAYCSEAFYFNAGSGLQMHGGVGFTWEYDIQLYFKRAKSTETLLGTAVWHREQLAKMLLD